MSSEGVVDPILHVVYVTSTSIFVPDLGPASPVSTMLHALSCESVPGQTLAQIVGAGSNAATGNGLLVHIFRCLSDDEAAFSEIQKARTIDAYANETDGAKPLPESEEEQEAKIEAFLAKVKGVQ